ncbi:hypothetical protein MOC63_10295, partial [Bacillus paralicheniformis]|uniref:hypothetical protein n=1 Tax=Bacillus paralicheniformis TaxID=1648923 RepID=UPI00227F0EF8
SGLAVAAKRFLKFICRQTDENEGNYCGAYVLIKNLLQSFSKIFLYFILLHSNILPPFDFIFFKNDKKIYLYFC